MWCFLPSLVNCTLFFLLWPIFLLSLKSTYSFLRSSRQIYFQTEHHPKVAKAEEECAFESLRIDWTEDFIPPEPTVLWALTLSDLYKLCTGACSSGSLCNTTKQDEPMLMLATSTKQKCMCGQSRIRTKPRCVITIWVKWAMVDSMQTQNALDVSHKPISFILTVGKKSQP